MKTSHQCLLVLPEPEALLRITVELFRTRSGHNVQDHSLLREDEESVLERVSLPQAPPSPSGRALCDGGEGLHGFRSSVEGELHADRGGRSGAEDTPEERSIAEGEGLSGVEEDDARVRRGHPGVVEAVPLALHRGDSQLDPQEALWAPDEEARREEGHGDTRQNLRLQHTSARLSEVYQGLQPERD